MNTENLKRLAETSLWTGRWYYGGCDTVMGTYCSDDASDHDEIAHPMPLGVAEFIAAANPAAVLELIQQCDELLAALELFMERVDEPPEANCSCHISPPCNDCVENWGLREAFSYAKEAIAKAHNISEVVVLP